MTGDEELRSVQKEHILCFQWFTVDIMVFDESMVIVVVISLHALTNYYCRIYVLLSLLGVYVTKLFMVSYY